MSTLTIEIPEAIRESVENIDDVEERIVSFLREQVLLSKTQAPDSVMQSGRVYSPEVEALYLEVQDSAAKLQNSGVARPSCVNVITEISPARFW